MAYRDDNEIIANTHNTARFFTENRHISWVFLVAVLIWGAYSFISMPKRKDPEIPVLVAVAVCPWPGASAEQVEEQVTKLMEETIAQNSKLHEPEAGNEFAIKSTTLPGVAIVQIQLEEGLKDTTKEFNDINLRLDYLNNQLPEGAGPIKFNSGFGNTAAMMLTIASPKESEVELELRAKNIGQAITQARASKSPVEKSERRSFIIALPGSVDSGALTTVFELLAQSLGQDNVARDITLFSGPGFIGLDTVPLTDDEAFLSYADDFSREKLGFSSFHIDAWDPVLIGDPSETENKLRTVDGDKYSYRELENITELMTETFQTVPQVSIIQRSGVLDQRIYLDYSQDVFASYGITPYKIKNALDSRNVIIPGGEVEVGAAEVIVYPSGAFSSVEEIGNVAITDTTSGVPVYLRDLGEIVRGYQSPPSLLNYYKWRDKSGNWHRSRAVTVAVQMRDKEQIQDFGTALDNALSELKPLLPHDIIIAKTSDQPQQVKENLDLFMKALMEAVILVIIVAWIGFREWRSALLMSISIPLTLAMTFGFAYLLNIELQQVSIASLIIALGLLVDDPVVADDAIKSNLTIGHPPIIAAWLGPTKLARAIMFATATNIVAYMPFLLVSGTTGEFIYSLPIVLACALISSRIVSMTFVPLLGYYLLRPKNKELTLEEKREQGLTGLYYRIAKKAIEHRKAAFAISMVFFIIGAIAASTLKSSFFPADVQYLSYVDIWMPNEAPLSSTNETVIKADQIIKDVAEKYSKDKMKNKVVLEALTSFVGGGSPRFWSTVAPEQQQKNYAQMIIRLADKNDTPLLAPLFQSALSEKIPGAHIEVRQIQLNAVDYPIEIHLTGRTDLNSELETEAQDVETLRELAKKLKDILRDIPETEIVRDDWFEDSFTVKLAVDPDRAELAGVSNKDVAISSLTALSGYQFTTYKEGDKNIPVMARLQVDERSGLSELKSMYVYGITNDTKIPLIEVADIDYSLDTSRVIRRNHFRALTVIAFPAPGELPSTILKKAEKKINAFVDSLPPGYELIWGGERAKQQQGFRNLAMVLLISVIGIFLALVLQFGNAVKPLLVLAAVPYGIVGSLIAIAIMGEPFGFMAFLGMIALVGVIVSHVIVLFDYIEEMHKKGEPFKDSLLDAGIQRLRPILITVGATILALFPLAIDGGPLWQPLCYAQIGGLALATGIELVLVPVFYAIFVIDFKIIKWDGKLES
jgi:multidrug efflux pump